MKKTRTLTFHFPLNNGAFLQTYALQQVLINHFGVNNEIINYCSEQQKQTYRILQPIHGKADILKNLFSLLHYRKLRKRKKSFERMQHEFLILTERVKEDQQVYCLAEEADLNIVGSDQVWNTSISACTPAFFLQGVKAKKITYAASMGSHADVSLIEKYIPDIEDFEALGLRESAQLSIFDFYKKDKTIVLDPTILLDKADYTNLYKSSPIHGKYILLYSMRFSSELLQNVKRISDALGLPVVVPFTTYKAIKCLKYNFKIIYDASPDVFLNLMEYAELCLTNSFHGTAFSIIYKKNFFYICDRKNGKIQRDDRIDDLLDALKIERNISVDTDLSTILNAADIPYQHISNEIVALREQSLEFLRKHLDV